MSDLDARRQCKAARGKGGASIKLRILSRSSSREKNLHPWDLGLFKWDGLGGGGGGGGLFQEWVK